MVAAAGTGAGQRQLNGPQTTGREYRNLSEARHPIRHEYDVRIPIRDGTILLADVYRPDAAGAFPALLAAAPYPRQIQDLGAPAGVIEAGATDFWVPRGYVHVIANLRGTGGSGGDWGFFDTEEREDLYDLVEWIAAQPWSDGGVGMIGISYYAMAQLEAATQQPPHLTAIFPFDVTMAAWEAASHNGLLSSAFITPWISTLGVLSRHGDRLFRGVPSRLLRRLLAVPAVHRRFATSGGDQAVKGLRLISRFRHADQPWSDLWQAIAVEHPTRDAWWDERDLTGLLGQVTVPVYLGSEWPNVPLHLSGTLAAWGALSGSPNVRLSILGDHGLPWPWESMHIEALAWFDHWMKGQDTGILDGPAVRYWLPGAQQWRVSDVWPPAADYTEWSLNPDGELSPEPKDGERQYLCLAPGVRRSPGDGPLPLPDELTWTTTPLPTALDVVGHLELRLTATATAADTAWIVLLQDVAPDGTTTDVTQGWLRAGLREVDEAASTPGQPVLPMRTPIAVPPGVPVDYRIPLVANARRFAAGHRIKLILTSDDTAPGKHAMQLFSHTPVGTSSLNTVHASSRLLLPVLRDPDTD